MARRIVLVLVLNVALSVASRAGGPAFVAGSAFDPSVKGQPVVWANGSVQYFTDQGDLSPILNSSQADAFVAAAFLPWTSISGVALTAAQSGHLAEDVNGSTISCQPDGTCTMPADIQANALTTPLGIVYDIDGTVTDAFLGTGAGGSDYCFSNAVYGGPDNFSTDAHIVHGLVVINGMCASKSDQLPDVQYRLERVFGRVIGLGWAQTNLNVQTGNPRPTPNDFEGFSLMHFEDSIACVPITVCYGADAAVPKMDDRAALRWLYPAIQVKAPGASGNSPQTARIHGSVYFTDPSGNPLQPMQGVNVVARWIDSNGQPSRKYVATSVSGFAFHGSTGNIINGHVDGEGLRYDQFGSDDTALEGFFDLDGLEIPDGSNSAQYQLSIEAVDPTWSLGVGPYASPVDPNWYFGIASNMPSQVAPSGEYSPSRVTVQAGGDAAQNILMQLSEQTRPHPGDGSNYANPADLPVGGGWGSWVSGYGVADFFQFTAQANRTASVTATALDESGQPTQSKMMPVIGVWQLSDPNGDPAPAATPMPFNTINLGETRLDVQFNATEAFRLGVADFRGDGRPDYQYAASILYSDIVTPARLGLQGGPVTLTGLGFHPGLELTVGSDTALVLETSATHIELIAPAGSQDGSVTITVTDPLTGGFSQMQNALTYGASANDLLLLIQGAEPSTPVGAVAANPIRVRAVASDGITPVWGATVGWSTTNGTQLSACNWSTNCLVLTDESGEASTQVMPTAVGASTITAQLAPEVFSQPQTQQATLVGTESSLDIAGAPPTQWVAQGATIDVPLIAKVLNLGVPQPNITVNFILTRGIASLSALSATTNGSGYATVTAHLVNHASEVQVSACVAPNNAPCVTLTLFATPASMWTLAAVSGTHQSVPVGQAFQPLVLSVTDGAPAADPVLGAIVTFDTTLARVSRDQRGHGGGDTIIILGTSTTQVTSDANGVASIVPSVGDVAGPCEVLIAAHVASARLQFQLQVEQGARTSPEDSIGPRETPRGRFGMRSQR
jgi:hypothetical protein